MSSRSEVFETASLTVDEKNTANNWQDEARDWMSKRPEKTATVGGDCCSEKAVAEVKETAETPEIKAAYKKMLESTKDADPATVADSIKLFGDLAVAMGAVPKSLDGKANADTKAGADAKTDSDKAAEAASEELVKPAVSDAYRGLLQRGLNPVLIVDVLNIAGDLASIAASPQGQKLFADIKTFIGHLRG